MAVPFNSVDDSSTEEELLALCQRLMLELCDVLRHLLDQQASRTPASPPRTSPRSRLPSCEEEAEEDDEPEDPPPAAEGQTDQLTRHPAEPTASDLPDVVPRTGPRQREVCGAAATLGSRRKTPSSAFTKYLTGHPGGGAAGSAVALATSDSTACFALPLEEPVLPDLLCSVPGPSRAPSPCAVDPSPLPSPAPRPRRQHPLPQPLPLPRRKRRLRKPSLSRVSWEHEEGIDKALLSKMAAGVGAVAAAQDRAVPLGWRPGHWMRVGEDLRHIADEFSENLKPCDVVDSPTPTEKSLFSLLLPQARGTIWTTVVLLVGWRLLARMR